jgi:hypothetical protein
LAQEPVFHLQRRDSRTHLFELLKQRDVGHITLT